VNWGGNSGGTRAQAALQPVVVTLGMILTHGHIEANFPQPQVADGVFTPNDQQNMVLQSQFDEFVALHEALAK